MGVPNRSGVVLAVDAGTTGVRTLAVAEDGAVVGSSYREFPQHFPRPGWVEHDPGDIWAATVATLGDVVGRLGRPVAAVGLTNQRETVVVWDRRDGRPLHRAVVWQDRRTAGTCDQLAAAGHLDTVRSRTGLVLDPYFSATKLAWLFSSGEVHAGPECAFGTVDSWLVWKLTDGRRHLTDVSNASRTLLFDIDRLAWDPELAELFGVPLHVLPEVVPSSGRLATTAPGVVPGLRGGVPISGVAGDQQAALFGQACFTPGMAKNTYGTDSFILMNVGERRPAPADGLLTSLAWAIEGVSADRVTYALEGSVFVTGAALQWLRDGLGLLARSDDAGPLAASVTDTAGAFFVPALTGMGSPWWDPRARGTVVGLSRGVGRAHLVRAAVEAMAYQTADVVSSMSAVAGRPPRELRVDGGASVMDLLLQLQADLLGVPVLRSAVSDTTALGAAYLAGLAEGVWASTEEISRLWAADRRALPPPGQGPASPETHGGYGAWRRAVERARRWATDDAGDG